MSSSVHQHRSLPRINQEGEAVLKAALPEPSSCSARSIIHLVLKVKEASEDRIITTEKRVALHHLPGGDNTSRGKGADIPPCCAPFFPPADEAVPASTWAELGCQPSRWDWPSGDSWQRCSQGLGGLVSSAALHCGPLLICSP